MATKVVYLANVAKVARSTHYKSSIRCKRCRSSTKYTVAEVAMAAKVECVANGAKVARTTQLQK